MSSKFMIHVWASILQLVFISMRSIFIDSTQDRKYLRTIPEISKKTKLEFTTLSTVYIALTLYSLLEVTQK